MTKHLKQGILTSKVGGAMVFKRSISEDLARWKASPYRKPLVIRGARQVGKTTIIREFGKSFHTFFPLNLELQEHRDYFTKNLKPGEILQKISLDLGIRRTGETLLFLDEIQHCPEAISLLRYFYEDLGNLYVIAAGSLLEVMMDLKQISFPVGRIEYLYLFPLNFQEFLKAVGEDEALSLMNTIPVPSWAAEKLEALFKTYTLVGGMPEAVDRYLGTRDIVEVGDVYRNLFTAYTDDVAKYARTETEKNILRFVIEASPGQTGKRITFERYGNSNYRSREVASALRILERAMLLYLRYPVTSFSVPLLRDLKRKPRLQFLDTGMLNFKAGLQSAYFGPEPLDALYKGMLAEQVTAQELLSAHCKEAKPPEFWVREESQSNAEVDFIIQHQGALIPVEVKSGKTGTLRSLHSWIDRSIQFNSQDMSVHTPPLAVRLYSGQFSIEHATTVQGSKYTLIHLPLFLASRIRDYVDRYGC
jgi:predicted AAA+ superfamily ATPase